MIPIKLIALLILLLSTNIINGQPLYARGDIHKIYSFNKQYFLRTIPNEDSERTKNGNTIVYKVDSTELYKIPRYFETGYYHQQVFLSNDGRTITDIIDEDLTFSNYRQKCITIYKNDQLFKEYALHDIIDCNSKDQRECTLFYFDEAIDKVNFDSNFNRTIVFKKNATVFEKQLTRNAIYQLNDTLLIFSKMGQLLKLNLSSGNIVKEKLIAFDTKIKTGYDTLHIQSYKVKNPQPTEGFPMMVSGKKTEDELADYMGMQNFKNSYSDKYKIYSLSIAAVIDLSGNARVTEVNNYHFNGIPAEDKIYSFFRNNKFETKSIPLGVDGWKFYCSVSLINKNLEIAEREKQEEIEKQQQKQKEFIERKKQQDRKRIDERSKILDVELEKKLKQEEVDIIKNLKSMDQKSICHFKFPNDPTFNCSYLIKYKDNYKDFPVKENIDKSLNFELRLWSSGSFGNHCLFRLTYNNEGVWKAEKYIEDNRKVISSDNKLPENWDRIWDRLLLDNILSLPDNPPHKGKMYVENGDSLTSEMAITDGTSYSVELLSKSNNRKYSIDNPIGYFKFYTDSKPLKDFNSILGILSKVFDYGFE
jgi:hypothetical protein